MTTTTFIHDATDPRCEGITLDAAWAYSPATPLAPGDRAFAAREYRGAAAKNRVIDRALAAPRVGDFDAEGLVVWLSPMTHVGREPSLVAYAALGYFPDCAAVFCRTCGGEGVREIAPNPRYPWHTIDIPCPACTDPEDYLP